MAFTNILSYLCVIYHSSLISLCIILPLPSLLKSSPQLPLSVSSLSPHCWYVLLLCFVDRCD